MCSDRNIMAKNSFVQPAVLKFNGHYDHWAMLMENFLHSKEYWGMVESGIPTIAEGVYSHRCPEEEH